MAALCGLVGFVSVHHYAPDWRPADQFAVVIDAGSSHTRSNLFKLTIDADKLGGLANPGHETSLAQEPLRNLFQAQQIGTCVNGGPLTAIADRREADELIRRCLEKFSNQIQRLDFVGGPGDTVEVGRGGELDIKLMDANNGSDQLALMNRRVNSIVHVHLGATAGMRSLEKLNATRAQEKLNLIEQAIIARSKLITNGTLHINSGYVGALSAADEASLCWVSLNYVCDTLIADAPSNYLEPESALPSYSRPNNTLIDQVEDGGDDSMASSLEAQERRLDNLKLPHSIGILEMGGVSAQLAFQVPFGVDKWLIRNISLDEQQLALFNGRYKLAARSDLCLGNIQASLRMDYLLLHKTFGSMENNSQESNAIEITNVCLQRGSRVKLTGSDVRKMLQGPCLMPNDKAGPELLAEADKVRTLATGRDSVTFVGTGEVDKCDALLNVLFQPELCRRYFLFCPQSKIRSPPPKNMPFVTISGYNHTVRVLNIKPASLAENTSGWSALEEVIADELGGYSVDYDEFVRQSQEFCSTDVSELTQHFPKLSKHYQDVICFQLVHVRKMLVEFYQLTPPTRWQQIKFLIFEPRRKITTSKQQQAGESDGKILNVQPDFAWTLGLLMNFTNQQLKSSSGHDLYHQHEASPMRLVRLIMLLVVACSLIAIVLLIVSAVRIGGARDKKETIPNGFHSGSYNLENHVYTMSYPTDHGGYICTFLDAQHGSRPL